MRKTILIVLLSVFTATAFSQSDATSARRSQPVQASAPTVVRPAPASDPRAVSARRDTKATSIPNAKGISGAQSDSTVNTPGNRSGR